MRPRATVILPTFGDAPFIRWALASAQKQSVRDLEICVICDGSPPHMLRAIEDLARDDTRVKVFVFPKGPRHGEIYRHEVILEKTEGPIICYLSHDDLFLPWHVESMERALGTADFVHSIPVGIGLADVDEQAPGSIHSVSLIDLQNPRFRKAIMDWPRYRCGFGLVYGAHSREAYLRLPNGWATAPPGINTDVFMWEKFLVHSSTRCQSLMEVTALHFDRTHLRTSWTPERRDAELARWFPRTQQTGFRGWISDRVLRSLAEQTARSQGIGAETGPGQGTVAKGARVLRDLWSIWRSGFFDARWYMEHNPDVRAAGVNPLLHFVRWGGPEGRSPGPGFDSSWYLRAYPEVPASTNPLSHFLRHGKRKGYLPLP